MRIWLLPAELAAWERAGRTAEEIGRMWGADQVVTRRGYPAVERVVWSRPPKIAANAPRA